MSRGDFLGFGVTGTIMGTMLTIPPVAFLLGPVIKVDVLSRSDVDQGFQEVGPVSEVPLDKPKVFVAEFPLRQAYGDRQIQEQSPETPRSQERFVVKNAIWVSWKRKILEQGRQGSSADRLGKVLRPSFLDRKSEGFTGRERREIENSLNVLSNSCPHLGCPVHWVSREGKGEFLSPCHGSIFDLNGSYVGGTRAAGNVPLRRCAGPRERQALRQAQVRHRRQARRPAAVRDLGKKRRGGECMQHNMASSGVDLMSSLTLQVLMFGIMIVILLVGLWTAWRTRSKEGAGSGARHPIDVLGERYARGEITTEEYQERRKVLTHAAQGSLEREENVG